MSDDKNQGDLTIPSGDHLADVTGDLANVDNIGQLAEDLGGGDANSQNVGEIIEQGLEERRSVKDAIRSTETSAVPGNPGHPNINKVYGKQGSKNQPHARQNPAPQPKMGDLINKEIARTGAPIATVNEEKPAHVSLVNIQTQHVVIGIYRMLQEYAEKGETITYEMIAQQHGLPVSGSQLGQAIAPLLERIFVYCRARRLPELTSIVVRKSGLEKGVPGSGFWKLLASNSGENPRYIAGVCISAKGKPAEITLANKKKVALYLQSKVFDFYSMKGI